MLKSMIRMIAFIVIIAVFGIVPAALAQYDQEILFRNIPWEFDIVSFSNSISENLDEQGVDYMYDFESSDETMVILEGYSDNGSSMTDYYFPEATCYDAIFSISSDFDVAGVHTDSIWVYAIPALNESVDSPSKENTEVVYAKYDMELESYSDKKEIYNQLCEKLINIYGSPDRSQSDMKFWYGANETFCMIKQFGGQSIELSYGKTDLPDRVEALMINPSDIDDSDYDGL